MSAYWVVYINPLLGLWLDKLIVNKELGCWLKCTNGFLYKINKGKKGKWEGIKQERLREIILFNNLFDQSNFKDNLNLH